MNLTKFFWGFVLTISNLFCLLGCSYNFYEDAEAKPLNVTFLDVGQGLSVLIEHNKHYGLFDIGPDSVGVVDSLKKRGIDTLDFIVISHFHRDHGGGFLEIIPLLKSNRLFVKRLIVGSDNAKSFISDSIYRIANTFKIPIDTVTRGDSIYFAEGFKFDVLWPLSYGDFYENNASVTLQISSENSKENLLLVGDLDSAGESRLLELSPNMTTTLLQVGHHGSAGSSSLKFLSTISPNYAVISVGKNNRYGHPKKDVEQKLRYVIGDSSKIFRTDLHGNVNFEFSPDIGIYK